MVKTNTTGGESRTKWKAKRFLRKLRFLFTLQNGSASVQEFSTFMCGKRVHAPESLLHRTNKQTIRLYPNSPEHDANIVHTVGWLSLAWVAALPWVPTETPTPQLIHADQVPTEAPSPAMNDRFLRKLPSNVQFLRKLCT